MILGRIVSVLLVLAMVGASAAAAGDGIKADPLEPSTDWVSIVYALVGLAGISVVGFKNSKRTHLD